MNTLCGRAFYGETSGSILLNGQETSIEEHKGLTGFVPQDDIVFAELTVKENLIYAGRFRLPRGTPMSEIEDLADFTLASLGLARVANSPVGDVHRRGVSGGEKKRVNIGLELMARPKVINCLQKHSMSFSGSPVFLTLTPRIVFSGFVSRRTNIWVIIFLQSMQFC